MILAVGFGTKNGPVGVVVFVVLVVILGSFRFFRRR